MRITVNGESLELEEQTPLFQVLEKRITDLRPEEPAPGIAVAVNDQVIPARVWQKTLLVENDAVLIIQATQGG